MLKLKDLQQVVEANYTLLVATCDKLNTLTVWAGCAEPPLRLSIGECSVVLEHDVDLREKVLNASMDASCEELLDVINRLKSNLTELESKINDILRIE